MKSAIEEKAFRKLDEIRDYLNILVNTGSYVVYQTEINKEIVLESNEKKTIIQIDHGLTMNKAGKLFEKNIENMILHYILESSETKTEHYVMLSHSTHGGFNTSKLQVVELQPDFKKYEVKGKFSKIHCPLQFPEISIIASLNMNYCSNFQTSELKVSGSLDGLIKEVYNFIKDKK